MTRKDKELADPLIGKRAKLITAVDLVKVGTEVCVLGLWYREGQKIFRVREVCGALPFSVTPDQIEEIK